MMIGGYTQLSLLAGVVFSSVSWAQVAIPAAAPVSSQPVAPSDSLGRETPRGTVLGFLYASRKGDYETARRYLNAPRGGAGADTLAHQLSAVLDRRLPARLYEVSSRPERSLYFPDRPDVDLVGTIATPDGTVDIVEQRVDRGKNGVVWLFSKETLDAIPGLYKKVDLVVVRD